MAEKRRFGAFAICFEEKVVVCHVNPNLQSDNDGRNIRSPLVSDQSAVARKPKRRMHGLAIIQFYGKACDAGTLEALHYEFSICLKPFG